MSPSVEDFRALARSGPWLWRTLRFTLNRDAPVGGGPEWLRAWVDRPHGLRVEDADGRLLQASWEQSAAAGRPDHEAGPLWRPDGLVARRPSDGWGDDPYRYDDPMFENYRWVAMLHPFELADGVERDEVGDVTDGWGPGRSPIVAIVGPGEVVHEGRPAWEATVATTPAYAARCSCCPMLDGVEATRQLRREGWDRPPAGLPTAWRVRLDRGTGVVVQLSEEGGRSVGGWTMRIEAVDGVSPRSLFGESMPGRVDSRFVAASAAQDDAAEPGCAPA